MKALTHISNDDENRGFTFRVTIPLEFPADELSIPEMTIRLLDRSSPNFCEHDSVTKDACEPESNNALNTLRLPSRSLTKTVAVGKIARPFDDDDDCGRITAEMTCSLFIG